MLKKFLAGLSVLALSLGMIALVAGPASAHTNTITASVACNTDNGSYTITWKVKNSEASNPETITASSNTAVVPIGTQIAGGATGTFTQTVASSGSYSLTLTGTWTNDNYVHQSTGSVNSNDFTKDCTPQLVKVIICHATPADTATGGWVPTPIDDDAIDNHNSHFTEHEADIIPAYDYWVQDHGVWTKLHFAGKNLDTVFFGATGAEILAAGCKVPVTPAAPTFTPAVCTDGAAGNGSYTIPATAGIDYWVSTDGGAHYAYKGQGTYPVTPVVTVLVKVTLTHATKDIYKLVGTTSWSFTFTSAGDCVTVPAAPTVTSQVCTVNQDGNGVFTSGYITIAATANVQYYINGSPVSSGKNYLAPGTYQVTATATNGYALSGYPDGGWSRTIDAANACGNVIPTAPSVSPQTCEVDQSGNGSFNSGSITIPVTAGVNYFINGSPAASGVHFLSPGTYTVTAEAIPDQTLAGYPDGGWSEVIESANPCGVITPDSPTVSDQTCTVNEDGKGSYTDGAIVIPASTTVNYFINGAPAAEGSHPEAQGTYVVTAVAIADYTLSGYPDGGWSLTVASALPCGNATPSDPTVTDQTCTVDGTKGFYVDGAITVPASTTVSYFINGVPVTAGSHPEAPGTYTVTAVAIPNYTLTGYPDGGWSLTVKSAFPCGDLITHPDVIPTVTFTQLTCTRDGSYTLSNDLGDADAVIWTVDGSPVAPGTYQVTSARTVTVHAEPNGPDFGFSVDTQKDWSFTFAATTTCDLKTLALTGTTPVGGMVLAYFLLIAGIGIVAVRTVRRRPVDGPQE